MASHHLHHTAAVVNFLHLWRRFLIIAVFAVTYATQDQRCPFGSDENAGLSPPPEFPDLMAAFRDTLFRIPGLHPSSPEFLAGVPRCPCAESTDWPRFNSLLCSTGGDQPFDLESFCNPITTIPPPSAETWNQETSTADLDGMPAAFSSPPYDFTAVGFISNGTSSSSSNITDPAFDASAFVVTSGLPPITGDGAIVAISIGAGLPLLISAAVIIGIIIQRNKGRRHRWMEPILKAFHSQRSDGLPFTNSAPSSPTTSQPTTPIQVLPQNGLTTNNNMIPSKWWEEKFPNEASSFVAGDAIDIELQNHKNAAISAPGASRGLNVNHPTEGGGSCQTSEPERSSFEVVQNADGKDCGGGGGGVELSTTGLVNDAFNRDSVLIDRNLDSEKEDSRRGQRSSIA